MGSDFATRSRTKFIHDSTLRDGEQMPGVVFSQKEKLELARMSVEFGCDFIDIMPSVSETERYIAQELAKLYPERISASCRAKREDIDLAVELGITQIVLFTPLSDIHLVHKLRINRDENLARALEHIDYARSRGLVVDFAGEDCSRADAEYLSSFVNAITGCIRIFYIADTVGCLTPKKAAELVGSLKGRCRLGLHFHNDFGMATANTLAGLRAGAEIFSGTFTGIGERAGNAPIEEICVALKYLGKIELSVDYGMLTKICTLVESYAGIGLQPHKPLVGKNAFCHESGMHADGVIKHPGTYEFIQPESVGQSRKFFFGKHSGRAVLRHLLGDVPENDLQQFLDQIKTSAESLKTSFSSDEVLQMFATYQKSVGEATMI